MAMGGLAFLTPKKVASAAVVTVSARFVRVKGTLTIDSFPACCFQQRCSPHLGFDLAIRFIALCGDAAPENK